VAQLKSGFSERQVSNLIRQAVFALIALTLFATAGLAAEPYQTHYRHVNVDGVRIFYREVDRYAVYVFDYGGRSDFAWQWPPGTDHSDHLAEWQCL
jgi:hypothetical protein